MPNGLAYMQWRAFKTGNAHLDEIFNKGNYLLFTVGAAFSIIEGYYYHKSYKMIVSFLNENPKVSISSRIGSYISFVDGMHTP